MFLQNIFHKLFEILGNIFVFLFSYGETPEIEDKPIGTKVDLKTFSKFELEVLDKLLKYVSLDTLKNCRLVNRRWSRIASTELKRRECVLEFIETKKKTFMTRETKKWLSELNNILEDEPKFKLYCGKFEFHGNMGSPDCLQFFALYGTKITNLVVKNMVHNFTRWSTLHDILGEDCTGNITDLTILGNNFDFDFSSTKDNVDLMLTPLPKLKIFRINYETTESTLFKVLDGAKNLELVKNFDGSHLAIFLESGKLIKKLTFFYKVTAHGKEEKKLNVCHINNEKDLTLDLLIPNPMDYDPEDRWWTGEMSRDLFKILITTKDSLEELNILPIGWLLEENYDNSKFPEFPLLKNLKISTPTSQSKVTPIFPPFLYEEPQVNFPCLDRMTLDFHEYGQEFWKNCFPVEVILPQVKILEILKLNEKMDDGINSTLEKMKIMFPNIQRLEFHCGKGDINLISNVFKIWQDDKLEELQFTKMDCPSNPFKVDSILTGIDVDDCAKLFANLDGDSKASEKNDVDTVLKYLGNSQPCIRDFKELCHFKIGFNLTTKQKTPPVSIVSIKYALNLMTNLETVFV